MYELKAIFEIWYIICLVCYMLPMFKTRFFIFCLLSYSFFMMSFAPQKEVSPEKRKWRMVEFQGFSKEELIQKKA